MAQFRHARRPSVARQASAQPARAASAQPGSLSGALMWLQRVAGNRAVSAELAAVQRDDAPAAAQFKEFAEGWPEFVTDNLSEARKEVSSDPVIAEVRLSGAYRYILLVLN